MSAERVRSEAQSLLRTAESAAEAATTVRVQEAIARLLVSDSRLAETAVAAVAEAGLLGHGIAFAAFLLAARRGTDAAGAIRRLADGESPPSGWSAYEVRVVTQEAEDEADEVVRRLPPADTGDPSHAVAGDPVAVVAALSCGASGVRVGVLSSPLAAAIAEDRWIRGLLAAAGRARAQEPEPGTVAGWLQSVRQGMAEPPPGMAAEGVSALAEDPTGGVLRCEVPYLDPFVAA